MREEEAYKIFSEMTPDVLDYVFCLARAYTEKDKEIEKMCERITSPQKTFRKRAPKTVKPAVKAPAAQPAAPQTPAAK